MIAAKRLHLTFTLLLTLLVTSALAPTLRACLWDYDTLATELKGLPDVRDVAAGVFERYPDRYYDLRVDRLEEHLASEPYDLEAIDSIAVAYDRLGQGDLALEWIEKKPDAIKADDQPISDQEELDAHWYRYWANRGTFYAHRWIHDGANYDATDDLDAAISDIEKAIEENPEAHFGREIYQLKALKWLRDTASQPHTGDKVHDMLGLRKAGKLHNMGDNENLKNLELEDAIEGLTGLIVQGAAWRSVDVFYALHMALLTDGKHSAGYYVLQRIKELVDDGAGSLIKDAPTGDKLIKAMETWPLIDTTDQVTVRQQYEEMREYADEYNEAWESYMLKRLNKGEHPDTDEAFWEDFEAPERPKLKGESALGETQDARRSRGPAEAEGPAPSADDADSADDRNGDDSPAKGEANEGAWGAGDNAESDAESDAETKDEAEGEEQSEAQSDEAPKRQNQDRRGSEKPANDQGKQAQAAKQAANEAARRAAQEAAMREAARAAQEAAEAEKAAKREAEDD